MKNRLPLSLVKWLLKLFVLILCFASTPSYAIETITYYHTDSLGSPVAGTDTSGVLLWKEDYKPYGERIRRQVESDKNTRWYTGHPEDKETGLTYAGARFYDSVIGRFLAVDPVGFKENNLQMFNRYTYGNNNPYKYVDPDGEEALVGHHPAFSNNDNNPFYHTAIVLRPDNPSDFTNHRLFKATNGKEATLGGQLAFLPFPTLVGKPNYAGDKPNLLSNLTTIKRPGGMTDTDFINSLISASERYNNDLLYAPFPELTLGKFYNSGGYVSGVIKAAGGTPPKLPKINPGYRKPIPINGSFPSIQTN